jgi:CMP-N,N'-diacetyllegionaminic acid synthase
MTNSLIIMQLKILAIIPARAGSKGLPGKNIKELNGKPLINYSIEEAKKSKFINRIIVSTDGVDIANVAQNCGAEVPFLRPKYLATDSALAIDNYKYTLKRLKEESNYVADILVILQPTSPLRIVSDIDKSIDLFIKKNADSVISLCKTENPVERLRKVTKLGKIENYNQGRFIIKNRADYEDVFYPNGAVFVIKPKLLFEKSTYYSNNSYAYLMPRERSIDIDTQFDFDMAEFIVQRRK